MLPQKMFWLRNLKSLHMCYFPQSPFPLATLKHCLGKKSLCWNLGSKMQFPCHLTAWEAGSETFVKTKDTRVEIMKLPSSYFAPRGIGPKHEWHQGQCVTVGDIGKVSEGKLPKSWQELGTHWTSFEITPASQNIKIEQKRSAHCQIFFLIKPGSL